ncbi:unnamed protein product [Tetraodon nigroviridis]|uniref:(spotted green pufferfish) hypothetical protein n=1 Tax=Tetraodon nigroviridis TaxID=99883 RepID=Q4RL15_TETNG|nr:unnamed protein product [Tetraodon nigroviridis]
MNGKRAPSDLQLLQARGASEICCAHPRPLLLYQSFFSSPLFSPGSPQLNPLLSTGGGNRFNRQPWKHLSQSRHGALLQGPTEPGPGYRLPARYDRRTATVVPGPLSFIKPTFTRTNSPYERGEKPAFQPRKTKAFIQELFCIFTFLCSNLWSKQNKTKQPPLKLLNTEYSTQVFYLPD